MNAKRVLDPLRTTALGVIRHAIEFSAAAIAVDDRFGDQGEYHTHPPGPVLFLTGRGIELALKAFLRHKTGGFPLDHNLVGLVRLAREAGLDVTDEDFALIETLNGVYASKRLEYIETGALTLPFFGPTEELAQRLVLRVVAEIPGATRLLDSKQGELLKA